MSVERPTNNEAKRDWCEYGEHKEGEFYNSVFNGVSTKFNPQKRIDKYVHDSLTTFQSDIKSVRTPFYTASRYGVPAEFAVTLNLKDVERYKQKYPNIIIIFDINHNLYVGTHAVMLQSLLLRLDKVPVHQYQHRVDDTSGNAKASYILDCRKLPKLIT